MSASVTRQLLLSVDTTHRKRHETAVAEQARGAVVPLSPAVHHPCLRVRARFDPPGRGSSMRFRPLLSAVAFAALLLAPISGGAQPARASGRLFGDEDAPSPPVARQPAPRGAAASPATLRCVLPVL